MTDDEIIEVVQAHKEGKKIQVRVLLTSKWYKRGIDDAWENMAICSWNFSDCEYRVAPEPRRPREWNLARRGDCLWLINENHVIPDEIITVREVLND